VIVKGHGRDVFDAIMKKDTARAKAEAELVPASVILLRRRHPESSFTAQFIAEQVRMWMRYAQERHRGREVQRGR